MKRSSFFTILGGAFLCIVFFSSCKNFLKASSIREEIEEYIAYANSDSYKIIFKAEKNSGIITKPAGGEISAKVTDTFDIAFNTAGDHEFIRWEIFDAATNTVISNNDYLKIENVNAAESTCKLLKAPDKTGMKLTVRAIVTKRPQVIRQRPADSPGGVVQNSVIEITFDHDMDKSSIYFSTKEKKELIDELGLTDKDFLADGTNLYGYTKNGQKYYKNITITNNKNDENLLSYFDKPFFTDSRTLKIRPLNPPPEPETDILCTFNKDFCFLYEDGTPISMRESENHIYSTMKYIKKVPRISVEDNSVVNSGGEVLFWSSERNVLLNSDGRTFNNPWGGEPITVCPETDSKKIRIGFIFQTDDISGSCIKKDFSLEWWKVTSESAGIPIETYSFIPYERFSEDYNYANCGDGIDTDSDNLLDSDVRYYYYDIPRSSDFCNTKGLYCFQIMCQNNQSTEARSDYFYYIYLEEDYSAD